MNEKLLYKDESFSIIGACFNVYKAMGSGFLEGVYQECLSIEFKDQNIPYKALESLVLKYKGNDLNQHYQPDFICFGKIIVEIKAVSKLANEHRAQILNYLNATGFELGILVNFGHYPKLEYERIINQVKRKNI